VIAGLYGMVAPELGDPFRQAALLAEEGVGVVQLRCKGWTRAAVRALAVRCRDLPTRIVINDDADLAAELGLVAHLGDEDGPARGPHGRSTHTIAQVRAEREALYIGYGPVFGTVSKDSPWPPRGLAGLVEAVHASPRPVVAIGGIEPGNVDEVRATGVAGWAVIGAIWRAPDPRSVIRSLR
jgi:thiamine-phosphate pyrophosphorylase